MKLETNCVVCGNKEVYLENLCKNCFAKDHPFVESPPEKIEIRFCTDCGDLKSSNRWLTALPFEARKEPSSAGVGSVGARCGRIRRYRHPWRLFGCSDGGD